MHVVPTSEENEEQLITTGLSGTWIYIKKTVRTCIARATHGFYQHQRHHLDRGSSQTIRSPSAQVLKKNQKWKTSSLEVITDNVGACVLCALTTVVFWYPEVPVGLPSGCWRRLVILQHDCGDFFAYCLVMLCMECIISAVTMSLLYLEGLLVLRALFFAFGLALLSAHGARCECEKHGMIRARFSSDNKVSVAAFFFFFYWLFFFCCVSHT